MVYDQEEEKSRREDLVLRQQKEVEKTHENEALEELLEKELKKQKDAYIKQRNKAIKE